MKVLAKKGHDIEFNDMELNEIEDCSKVLHDILDTMGRYHCDTISASGSRYEVTKEELDECIDVLEYLYKLHVDTMY